MYNDICIYTCIYIYSAICTTHVCHMYILSHTTLEPYVCTLYTEIFLFFVHYLLTLGYVLTYSTLCHMYYTCVPHVCTRMLRACKMYVHYTSIHMCHIYIHRQCIHVCQARMYIYSTYVHVAHMYKCIGYIHTLHHMSSDNMCMQNMFYQIYMYACIHVYLGEHVLLRMLSELIWYNACMYTMNLYN